MSSKRKLNANSLPHIPGYTVWENANGFGRPGYLRGSGNQYSDLVNALSSAGRREARIVACMVLFIFGAIVGGTLGQAWLGGPGAVIGIVTGAAAGVAVGYFLGLFLVRLVAVLLVLVPLSFIVWIAGTMLIRLWHS